MAVIQPSESSSATTLDRLKEILADVPANTLAHDLKRKALDLVAAVKKTVNQLLVAAQKRHTQDYDRIVQRNLKLIVDTKVS